MPDRGSADQADLVDLLAEERHVLVGAVGGEAVAGVEAVRARVVGRDPEVHGLLADRGVEELLPDAGAVVGVEEVDEVELALAGRVLVARGARADEADDLAVDEGGELLVLLAPLGVVVPQLAMRRGRGARMRLR